MPLVLGISPPTSLSLARRSWKHFRQAVQVWHAHQHALCQLAPATHSPLSGPIDGSLLSPHAISSWAATGRPLTGTLIHELGDVLAMLCVFVWVYVCRKLVSLGCALLKNQYVGLSRKSSVTASHSIISYDGGQPMADRRTIGQMDVLRTVGLGQVWAVFFEHTINLLCFSSWPDINITYLTSVRARRSLANVCQGAEVFDCWPAICRHLAIYSL